LLLNKI